MFTLEYRNDFICLIIFVSGQFRNHFHIIESELSNKFTLLQHIFPLKFIVHQFCSEISFNCVTSNHSPFSLLIEHTINLVNDGVIFLFLFFSMMNNGIFRISGIRIFSNHNNILFRSRQAPVATILNDLSPIPAPTKVTNQKSHLAPSPMTPKGLLDNTPDIKAMRYVCLWNI